MNAMLEKVVKSFDCNIVESTTSWLFERNEIEASKKIILAPQEGLKGEGLPEIGEVNGSNQFQSEILTAYELGYRAQASSRFSIDVAAFFAPFRRPTSARSLFTCAISPARRTVRVATGAKLASCMHPMTTAARTASYGRIVAVASTAGLKGYPYVSAYVASKHAVIGLVRSLALELASTHVTVNAVCPGFTDTELVSRSI